MRARHHDAGGDRSCRRCAALARPGTLSCDVCGQPLAEATVAAAPAADPPSATTSLHDDAEQHTPEAPEPFRIGAAAAAQLETLDALADEDDQTIGWMVAPQGRGEPGDQAPVTRELEHSIARRHTPTAQPWLEPLSGLSLSDDRPGEHAVRYVATDASPADAGPDPQLPKTTRLSRLVGALAAAAAALAVTRAAVIALAPPTDGDTVTDVVAAALAVALVAVCLALGVAFLMWLEKARRFADDTSVVPPRWSRSVAIAGWLIPVAGLFIGWRVLRDLWTASDPRTRDDPYARIADPPVLTGWVGALAVASVVWLAGTVVLGGSPLVDVVAAAAFATSAGCLASVVRQVTCWQDPGVCTDDGR